MGSEWDRLTIDIKVSLDQTEQPWSLTHLENVCCEAVHSVTPSWWVGPQSHCITPITAMNEP